MKAISGIGDIADRYDAFFLDVWGVLHNGVEPFPGTVDCLRHFNDANIKTCLVSNSPSRAGHVVDILSGMGILRHFYNDIVTSGESVWHGFEKYRGRSFWQFGTPFHALDQESLFKTFGVTEVSDPDRADFFVNDHFTDKTSDLASVEKVLESMRRRDLPMVCTNPDLVVDVGDEVFICPGTSAKIYEEIGGTVEYHGKPHAPIYAEAQVLLGGIEKARICAVGDGLHTDIQGANRFGIDCVLNLEGIHRRELTLDAGGALADNRSLKSLIDGQPHRPTYVMNGFRW